MNRLARVLPAVALFAAAGCVTTQDVDNIRRDINSLKQQVYSGGQRNVDEISELTKKLDTQSRELLKSNADVGVKITDLQSQLKTLQGRLEETNYRLTQLSQEIARTQRELANLSAAPTPATTTSATAPDDGKPEPPAAPPKPRPTTPSPDELFRSSYSDYLRGNYDLALAGFREYIELFPTSENAGAAHYWIGECWYAQKKYRESINEFDVVAVKFPKNEKAPSALLKKGFAYLELGEAGRGASQLQFVVREYSGSEEAVLARQKLASLGIEIR